MKIYLAGSISNNPSYKEQFQKAEQTLRAKGYAIMSPAILPNGFTQEDYMAVCISMLNVCNTAVFLNGWEDSEGARVEHAYCKKVGKGVFYEKDIKNLKI